jgi:hypothetical protein
LIPNPKARLQDRFHEVVRYRHLARRTEQTYWDRAVRYLRHFRKLPGKTEAAEEVPCREESWGHLRDMSGFRRCLAQNSEGRGGTRPYRCGAVSAAGLPALVRTTSTSSLTFPACVRLWERQLWQRVGFRPGGWLLVRRGRCKLQTVAGAKQ